MKIEAEDLQQVVSEILNDYENGITDAMKKAVDRCAKESNKEIKAHIPFKQHSGDYIRAFRLKTTFEDAFSKQKTWYVHSTQAYLTHLLEYGHATRTGGRTRAFPHIQYGEQYAIENMAKIVKEEAEKVGH